MSVFTNHQPFTIWCPCDEEPDERMHNGEMRDIEVAYLALGPAQGGYRHQSDRSRVGSSNEGNPASIGRPCRTAVRGRIAGQPQRRAGADQLDVDIKVILFFAVP